jgi:hypothetical protein
MFIDPDPDQTIADWFGFGCVTAFKKSLEVRQTVNMHVSMYIEVRVLTGILDTSAIKFVGIRDSQINSFDFYIFKAPDFKHPGSS